MAAGALCATLTAILLLPVASAPAKTTAPGPWSSAATQESWQTNMTQVPLRKRGCFTATFPKREWQEVACTATPTYPQTPWHGPSPEEVGNGIDASAQVPTGTISAGIGSFDKGSTIRREEQYHA